MKIKPSSNYELALLTRKKNLNKKFRFIHSKCDVIFGYVNFLTPFVVTREFATSIISKKVYVNIIFTDAC